MQTVAEDPTTWAAATLQRITADPEAWEEALAARAAVTVNPTRLIYLATLAARAMQLSATAQLANADRAVMSREAGIMLSAMQARIRALDDFVLPPAAVYLALEEAAWGSVERDLRGKRCEVRRASVKGWVRAVAILVTSGLCPER